MTPKPDTATTLSASTTDSAEVDVEKTISDWVEDNWDPDMTLGTWWERLAESGYAHPALPESAGGKGWNRAQAARAMRRLGELGVVGPPPGLGHMLAAPTIADHGTPEQIEKFIPPILTGRVAWCQLFSEPAAGSDLAGLQTKAERDGDEWIFTGQKVWTSQGHYADYGMLVARTDPEQPKHRGMSYFALPMDQAGVDVRPLKEMTGRTFFSEVFMERAKATTSDLIGAQGDGWRVANTTLGYERSSIGEGSAGFVLAAPGSRANNFDRKVGQIVEAARNRKVGGHAPGVGMKLFKRYRELAVKLGRTEDPLMRAEIIELYTLLWINRLNQQRARVKNQRTGGEPNIAKLYDAEIHRRFRDVSLRIVQADGMLAGASSSTDPSIAELALHACAPAIYGGTDQIQRNILGERVLGLPKEPGPSKDVPFHELPKNQ